MATSTKNIEIDIPALPAPHDQFIPHVAAHPNTPLRDLIEPYNRYDAEMRKVFAQRPDHPAMLQPSILPLYAGHQQQVKVRARNLEAESEAEKQAYIMPLEKEDRRPDASSAITKSLQEFQANFNLFSESSLADLDWSNVVAAGSAVTTSLLPVSEKYAETKRALRKYYHEDLAPASDIDLFLYGLTQEQAIEKIKQIERSIRDAILTEVTSVRTKHAITIVSQYPTRHVQIVLRLYRSASEILTGFDVDSSCVAYDGKQVYASPRALAAYMTQTNRVDLTRRSASYENRLSKYAHRGFEIHWPLLDRSRIDPTIFERSFSRSEGLARLLILERLPKTSDRHNYANQRRQERSRPAINPYINTRRSLRGNIKQNHEDEVSEWVDDEDVSNYHTFTIPYGPKFNPRKIERLLYTKDLLLNAEWNVPKDREVHLHRHPAFFGKVEDILGDCCGYCPTPRTEEEEEVAEKESKTFITGPIKFIEDDPGRQSIGSFNPITADDWTDMAYVGNTARLCQSIVDQDAEYVRIWLEQEGNDPNTRDYTGRTPLHLAVTDSSLEIVQLLIDHGARLVARLVDGRTALHLAATRGDVDIIKAIMVKSEANEADEEAKQEATRALKISSKADFQSKATSTSHNNKQHEDQEERSSEEGDSGSDSDISMVDAETQPLDSITQGSFVKVKQQATEEPDALVANDDDHDEPDVYDVNVVAWDTALSPLHLAIVNGHVDAVRCLVQEFGANALLPVKLLNDRDRSAKAAILTLVLALHLPGEKAADMALALLQVGASCAQADLSQKTVFQYSVGMRPDLVGFFKDHDAAAALRAIKHISGVHYMSISSVLTTALENRDSSTALDMLKNGASAEIDLNMWLKATDKKASDYFPLDWHQTHFERVKQPVIVAVRNDLPEMVTAFVKEYGVDVNCMSHDNRYVNCGRFSGSQGPFTLLDEVRIKIDQLKAWTPENDFPSTALAEWSAPFPISQRPSLPRKPCALRDDEHYLGQFRSGSYAKMAAEHQLNDAKKQYHAGLHEYNEMQEWLRSAPGLSKKQAAINETIRQLLELELELLRRGAKSYMELHPDKARRLPPAGGRMPEAETADENTFAVEFRFTVSVPSKELESRYMELFEAAWIGDSQKLKELTLVPWQDSKGETQAPLQIAVKDLAGYSPFSVAVLKGHLDLGAVILDIARAQYAPEDETRKVRYRLRDREAYEDDGSDGECADGNQFGICPEIVDDEFTVETIGEVSVLVKSRVSALTMLNWTCRNDLLLRLRSNCDGSLAEERCNIPRQEQWSLICYAIYEDNLPLLSYLISRGEHLTNAAAPRDDAGAARFYTITTDDRNFVLKCDKPHLLAEVIKRTGAGLPLETLMEKSGIEVPTAPHVYKGLSVHGKKRKDWAQRGGRQAAYEFRGEWQPPLLQAAKDTSLETIDWLLGSAPLRFYKEFAARNKLDKRVKTLEESPGGFEAVVDRFLNTRSCLALHCCLMNNLGEQSVKVLQYLIDAMPENLEARSSKRLTPLLVAFHLHLPKHARMLLDAGADQMVRDENGANILHHLFEEALLDDELSQQLPVMLDLIDKRVIPDLLVERSSTGPGGATPLSILVDQASQQRDTSVRGAAIFKVLMKYSDGNELQLVDGAGHNPLHVAISAKHGFALAQAILQHNPDLIFRENATGRTPLDMAEDAATARICRAEPSLCRHHRLERGSIWMPPHGLGSRYHSEDNPNPTLLEIPPSAFERGHEDYVGYVEDNDARVLSLLRQTRDQLRAKNGMVKRQLVSLNEANEVARRLALRGKQGFARPHVIVSYMSYSFEHIHPAQDEVGLWLRELILAKRKADGRRVT